jgi:hypothetical protein
MCSLVESSWSSGFIVRVSVVDFTDGKGSWFKKYAGRTVGAGFKLDEKSFLHGSL